MSFFRNRLSILFVYLHYDCLQKASKHHDDTHQVSISWVRHFISIILEILNNYISLL